MQILKSFFNNKKQKRICNAPFASMYFRQDGSVTPCCYNTSFVYGKYPKNSIKEIWQGAPIKKFRKLMINNDLSHGCHICEKHVNSNNIGAAGLQHFKNLQIEKNNPAKFEFELSHYCNLRCTMCTQNNDICSNYGIYDSEFVRQVSEFLPYLKNLNFLGGEPYVIDIYYELWEEINRVNPKCISHIQTNGTVLNKRVKNILKNGNYQISVSLDAVDESLYESIRINAKFKNVLENIHYFNEYMMSKNDTLTFAICPMLNNAYNIPDVLRFATDINARVIFHTVFSPPKFSLISSPKKELELILEKYQVFLNEYEEISGFNKIRFQVLINQVVTFIKNWEKSASLVDLNKDFDKCINECMTYLEQFLDDEEKHLLKDKLHVMFSGILKTFPVVYGLNQMILNNDGDILMNLIRDKNDQELLDIFICYTLFSID